MATEISIQCILPRQRKKCLSSSSITHFFWKQHPFARRTASLVTGEKDCVIYTELAKTGLMVVWGYATMVSALSVFYIISTLAMEIAIVGNSQSFIISPFLMLKGKKLGSTCNSGLSTSSKEFIYWARPSITFLHCSVGEGVLIQHLQMKLSTELIACFTATNKLCIWQKWLQDSSTCFWLS